MVVSAVISNELTKHIVFHLAEKVIGDASVIKRISDQLDHLLKPISGAPFDIFDVYYRTQWKLMMRAFEDGVTDMEEQCRVTIDDAFGELRNASEAFELLQRFRDMRSRAVIKTLLMDKFDDVLVSCDRLMRVKLNPAVKHLSLQQRQQELCFQPP